jgi:hypothetical protein
MHDDAMKGKTENNVRAKQIKKPCCCPKVCNGLNVPLCLLMYKLSCLTVNETRVELDCWVPSDGTAWS